MEPRVHLEVPLQYLGALCNKRVLLPSNPCVPIDLGCLYAFEIDSGTFG